jgi:hypothetical protein
MDSPAEVTRFTRILIEDPDDPDNLVLDLGVELCERMGWRPGDQLDWTNNEDGTWTLTKKTPD